MAKIDELFDAMFDELLTATEKQRELHTSAFGKDNALEIISKAELNRQKLDCWWGLFQDLKTEMMESGLFPTDKKIIGHKRSTKAHVIDMSMTPDAKPVSVTVLGQHKPVKYWKDILLFVCKVLYEKHPHRFSDIENEPTLQGRNNPYISIDQTKMRKPEKVEDSPYFVEINLSQAYCKKISHLLLAHFGYAPSDLVIEETASGSSCPLEDIALPDFELDGLKIGKRAKVAFGKLISGNKLPAEELDLLCESDYSKKVLGAYLPVLKLVPPGKTADEVRVDDAGRPRYYKEVYTTSTGRYVISSQWYEKQFPQFESYLAKHGI